MFEGKNKIMGFNYGNKEVRTVLVNGEPWFVAKDVCRILEIDNSTMALQRIPDYMKGVNSIESLGGAQETNIISEPGVYKLVFTSRKPEAEKFTNWVTSEVIPTIRKHGMYATDEMLDKLVESPDLVISIATKLKEEKAARIAAEEAKKMLEVKVAEDAYKVDFFDTAVESTNMFTLSEVAKMLGIGVVKMCKALRDANVLFYQRVGTVPINIPYQAHIKDGHFLVKMKNSRFGSLSEPIPQTFVTVKGMAYIQKKLRELGIEYVEGVVN